MAAHKLDTTAVSVETLLARPLRFHMSTRKWGVPVEMMR